MGIRDTSHTQHRVPTRRYTVTCRRYKFLGGGWWSSHPEAFPDKSGKVVMSNLCTDYVTAGPGSRAAVDHALNVLNVTGGEAHRGAHLRHAHPPV